MRALHINTNRDFGGGERQVLALVERSAAHGVEAGLFAREGGALLAAARDRGLRVHPLKLLFSFDPFAMRRVNKYIKSNSIDILHLHDGGAASVGILAARSAHVPVLVHRRIASPLRKSRITKLKYNPANIARFVAVSGVVRDVLIQHGIPADRISVVPSGLDIVMIDRVARPPQDSTIISLGTIGKLAPKKGVDLILEAFAIIHNREPRARLTIVGSGPDLQQLKDLASKLNIAPFVTFAGERPDAAALMAGWRLFLFASELEGSPGVLREAMALRVPIVSVDAPGSVELLDHCGVLTPRGDHRAFAAAALELLDSPARCEQFAEAGRARVVDHFSIEAMVEGTIRVAREAVAAHRR